MTTLAGLLARVEAGERLPTPACLRAQARPAGQQSRRALPGAARGRSAADRPAEAAIEVDPAYRGRGLGRTLAAAARHLLPEQHPCWAQVAPANAASVRTFLAAGYRPVGAEALLVP